eukprot:TRINITY_DN65682_c0_g1_i1.p1 TRINITY_DN65682_c0_g1~~TRINITY_DN65682_c0_g1_i1.p1  ORF type:complete len:638 (+),score=62.73 TRINITY_DN65682_c0_g1_i1:89-2002(+)
MPASFARSRAPPACAPPAAPDPRCPRAPRRAGFAGANPGFTDDDDSGAAETVHLYAPAAPLAPCGAAMDGAAGAAPTPPGSPQLAPASASSAPRVRGDGCLCADLWLHWVLPCLDFRSAAALGAVSQFLHAVAEYEPHWQSVAAQTVRGQLADALPRGATARDVVAARHRVARRLSVLRSGTNVRAGQLVAGSSVLVRLRQGTAGAFGGALLAGRRVVWWPPPAGSGAAVKVTGALLQMPRGGCAAGCRNGGRPRRNSAPGSTDPAAPTSAHRLRRALSFARERPDAGSDADDGESALEPGGMPSLQAPHCVAFHAPSRTLAVACGDRSVSLLDGETLQRSALLKGRAATGHTAHVSCMVMDRRHLFTGSFDRTVKVWSLRAKRVMHTLAGHHGAVDALLADSASAASAAVVVSLSHRGGAPNLLSHDAETGQCICTFSVPLAAQAAQQQHVNCLAEVDPGVLFAAGHRDGLSLYDHRVGSAVCSVQVPGGAVTALAAAAVPGGHVGLPAWLYTGGCDASPGISAVDVRAARVLWRRPSAHARRITSLCVDYSLSGSGPADVLLFSAGWDSAVRVWDGAPTTQQDRPLRELMEGTSGGVHGMSWDGLHLSLWRSQCVQVVDFYGGDTRGRPRLSLVG